MVDRPTGAVTFLFTDVEGSTQAWEHDPGGTAAALEVHDQVLRDTIESHGGFVFATGGDSFSVAFSSPSMALSAAVDAQRELVESGCGLRVRMGVHSGEAVERDGNYYGPPLNRTARLMSIGHGGQVLVSATTRDLALGSEFEFVELGEHRLADLTAPVRIGQLLAEGMEVSFPPLRSALVTDNLPMLGEVFGRRSDIETVTALLADHRLVTLTGTGGIGKTTLAITVATHMVEPFPDGRWLVDLTNLPSGSDHTAITGAVAGVDVRFSSIEALAGRRMLLILDNCEHVLDGTDLYLADLFAKASTVTVVATSREPLGMRSEKIIHVGPLSVEDESEHDSAINLFVERASDAGGSIDLDTQRGLIASICREVGGLPLAIELAAARTAIMTPDQILDRLKDRLAVLRGGQAGPEHHRTIEATIAWSYDLLDVDTRRLMRFVSVFEGGFELDQAEAVGGAEAIDQLGDLVRKSLVNRQGERFWMLEAVRQYSASRLRDTSEENEARQSHFEYFASWAQRVYHRAETIDLTPPELAWCTANLRSLHQAVAWGAHYGHPREAAEIAVVLWRHYIDALHGIPTHDWFEPLLGHIDRMEPQLQVVVLHGSGSINHLDGDLETAETLLQAAYEIHVRTGQVPLTAASPHNALAGIAVSRGQWEEAIEWYRAGIEATKDKDGEVALHLAGNLALSQFDISGDAQQALDTLEAARKQSRVPATNVTGVWNTLLQAQFHGQLGHHDRVKQLIDGIMPIVRQPHIRSDHYIGALCQLATIASREADLELAATQYLEAIELEAAKGHVERLWHTWESLHLAELLLALDEPHLASRAIAEYRSTPWPIPPFHLRGLEQVEAQVRSRLPDQTDQRANQTLTEALIDALTTADR